MSVDPEDRGGGSGLPTGRSVTGVVNDVRGSIHDPMADLLLPSRLSLKQWLDDDLPSNLLRATIAQQGIDLALHGKRANSSTLTQAARQKAPDDLAELERAVAAAKSELPRGQEIPVLFANVSRPERREGVGSERKLDSFRKVDQSVTLHKRLRDQWLDSNLDAKIDLRAPWFKVGDQGRTASCVGHAIADLIERQRRAAFDPPSARFIWQAAKELDGDERPTTMFAGAGTSLRAGMAVVAKFGYATESEIPTGSNELYYGSLEEFYDHLDRAGRKATHVVNLGFGTKSWLGWLYDRRPMVVMLRIGDNFLATGKDMVVNGDDVKKPGEADVDDPNSLLHAVLFVGYRFKGETGTVRNLLERNLQEGNVEDEDIPVEYLVRNSAGPDWGNQGYAWISQKTVCAQAGEAYGLLWDAGDKRA